MDLIKRNHLDIESNFTMNNKFIYIGTTIIPLIGIGWCSESITNPIGTGEHLVFTKVKIRHIHILFIRITFEKK